jgi:hypothetical protein
MGRASTRRWALGLAGFASWIAACGDDGASTTGAGGGGGAGGGTLETHAIYGEPLATPLLPFPSNRYTKPDPTARTGLRVDVSPATTADPFVASYASVVARMSELDGFSTTGGIAIGFDRPIDGSAFAGPQGGKLETDLDPASFAALGSPLLLIDVDPASPELGRAVGLLPRAFAQEKNSVQLADEFTIVARPIEPLAPSRRYLFVATRSLLDATGAPIAPTAETTALLDGTAQGAYADEVRAGLDVLAERLGVAREDVAVASTFTTASVHDQLVALAEDARTAAAPEQLEPWTMESEGEGDDPRIRFRAVFASPEYRREGEGTFEIDGDGRPVARDVVGIEVFLVFPDREIVGRRPVVIYQHGLGGDKDGCWGTAERLADLGAVVVAIDSPEHGSRGETSGTLESVFAFFGVDAGDLSFDLGRARDNFRQMAADQLELVRFLQTQGDLDLLPVGEPDGEPDVETSELLYIGHSFGAVQGPTIMALAPEIRHAVWNVGGDHLTLMMEDSNTFSVLVDAIAPDGTAEGALSRFFSATQAIMDPGDPLNYARFTVRETAPGVAPAGPRSVLLQEVIDDRIVPNSSSEVLARAAGLALGQEARNVPGMSRVALPSSGDGPNGSTAVLAQFATMNGGEKASHGELIFADEAREQYVQFFTSGLEDGVGTVIAVE